MRQYLGMYDCIKKTTCTSTTCIADIGLVRLVSILLFVSAPGRSAAFAELLTQPAKAHTSDCKPTQDWAYAPFEQLFPSLNSSGCGRLSFSFRLGCELHPPCHVHKKSGWKAGTACKAETVVFFRRCTTEKEVVTGTVSKQVTNKGNRT